MTRSRFHRVRPARRGFTLVELLVVLTIIGMLAALVAATVYAADQRSREAATRATIAKLHAIVMQIYDSYKTRRVPINTATIPNPMPPPIAAEARLRALRDIMRMEMPERLADIVNGPNSIPIPPQFGGPQSVPAPSAWQAYQAAIPAMNADNNAVPAECLYLIIMLLGGEDARRQFRDAEVGDTNNNGLMEFVDGWGRPIFFLRGAPGFNRSDLQPNIPRMTVDVPTLNDELLAMVAAGRDDHDPFDPRRIDMPAPANQTNPTLNDPPRGWRLVPLIYSAGRDAQYGIWLNPVNSSIPPWNNSTYQLFDDANLSRKVLVGDPYANTAFDNLHNHSIEASQQ